MCVDDLFVDTSWT